MNTIKFLADKLNISASSIRYYEKHGLLDIKRENNRYRIYDDSDEQQLKLILIMKYAGFTLKEINELLSLNDNSIPEQDCIERTNNLLLNKKAEILLKIENYKKVVELIDLMQPIATAETSEENSVELDNLINTIFNNKIKEK
ncbi:MerR family transcriptional regulator [Listeria seeligeri]|uniref:MerR family transcriptional regulator n=1 Tax=Listeria seeligeri TaxID=1640 RepID=A0A7X1C5U0_LISSE|nr:MerR family transcriptional regulator [Listeria seeligeri]MBC1485195.1 MerR family transcriptional regulator [Listeria seeligeri]MBC1576682.1 MerR family transcriptional regulator [Listeria seeligeri]MBC1914918.1 MerR family transcriptional regulator [Listeria seeligeri]MBC1988642.1 MerR family transcriptional regulator [Listeria seeligeri]MBC2070007.1 MerR family transcriptional regulator [Listeria seeligeri]